MSSKFCFALVIHTLVICSKLQLGGSILLPILYIDINLGRWPKTELAEKLTNNFFGFIDGIQNIFLEKSLDIN